MPTEYGYARCSTKKQDPERQFRNIRAVSPNVKFYFDAYTGTTMDRQSWNRLMKVIKPDDTIYFDSVSRMSRNADEGIQEYKRLYEKGVNLKFLKEPHIDTDVFRNALNTKVPLTGTDVDLILDGVNNYLMVVAEKQIRLAFEQAELEVTQLRQRTCEGIITAKANGKKPGRVSGRKYSSKKSNRCKPLIRQLSKDFEGAMKDTEIISFLGISKSTYYRYKLELAEETKAEEPSPEAVDAES